MKACFFCTIDPARILGSNAHCFMIRDDFPLAPGHSLVMPKRHVGSLFELTAAEQQALLALLAEAKAGVDAEFRPAAYNIGLNDGPAAGQSIPHVHMHLIPRYPGDCADPRGGIRWILPTKAKYWTD
ncbi:MAG: HIT family protein [Pseudomonadota bacterium]